MEFPLNDFKKYLKEIRKNHGLTQDDVVRLSNGRISRPTLQRYENGKYTPSIEILSVLSSIYKVDLYDGFNDMIHGQNEKLIEVEEILKKNLDLQTSKELVLRSAQLLKSKKLFPHLYPYYSRINLFAKGVYLKNLKKYRKANVFLLKALRQNLKNFNLRNYSTYQYSSLDYRILLNLLDSIAYVSPAFLPKAITVYEYMFKNCPLNDSTYSQICIQLGFFYLENTEYRKSKAIFSTAISNSKQRNDYYMLPQLYYGKACAEYSLSLNEYRESLRTSIFLSDIMGNEEFKVWLLDVVENYFPDKTENI